jgi:hypothetical protein
MLVRIVDGRDKTAIMELLSKEKVKVSKAKLKEFL